MRAIWGLLVTGVVTLSGCVEPPANEMEKAARIAVASELAAQQCPGQLGGYQAARQLRADADKQMATAKALGATDAVIAKARQDVQTAFSTSAAFTSLPETCNSLVGSLAWNTGS